VIRCDSILEGKKQPQTMSNMIPNLRAEKCVLCCRSSKERLPSPHRTGPEPHLSSGSKLQTTVLAYRQCPRF
jgi:hypothetical protein